MQLKIVPKIFLKTSLLVIAFLTFMNFLGMYGTFVLHKTGAFGLIDMFTLNAEANIPTYYSSALLLFASLLFGLISVGKVAQTTRFRYHWIGLSFVFLFLSVDEFTQIHELLDENRGWTEGLFDPTGALVGPWVVVYGVIVLAFVATYLSFFWHRSRTYQLIFGTSAAMYVGAAIGLEMVGATVWEVQGASWLFQTINSVEEVFEMLAITILNTGLLMYLREHSHQIVVSFGANGQLAAFQSRHTAPT